MFNLLSNASNRRPDLKSIFNPLIIEKKKNSGKNNKKIVLLRSKKGFVGCLFHLDSPVFHFVYVFPDTVYREKIISCKVIY